VLIICAPYLASAVSSAGLPAVYLAALQRPASRSQRGARVALSGRFAGGPHTLLSRTDWTAPDSSGLIGRLGGPGLRKLDSYGLSRTSRMACASLRVRRLTT
jgi:hypothetical protein